MKQFPYRRIVLAILALSLFIGAQIAFAQDHTVTLSNDTSYVGLDLVVAVGASLSDSIQSFEGKFLYDSTVLRYSHVSASWGITDSRLVAGAPYDTVYFAIASGIGKVAPSDSLFMITLKGTWEGDAFYAMQNFLFDERGNDGVVWARGDGYLLPITEHPEFGAGGPDFIHKDSVAAVVGERYILRDMAGDATCDGRPGALDAALILRRAVGHADSWLTEDPKQCITPIVVELQ